MWHRALLLRLETHVLPIAVCKSARIRLVPNSWDSYAGFFWHRALGAKACHPDRAVGEWRDLVLAFGKARQTLQTLRERGNQRFRCEGFPSPLDPHPFLTPTRGHPWTPYAGFCSTELRFGIEKAISCATALCKSSRIRRSRILGIVCRFSPWNVFPPMKPAVWGFGLGLLGGQGFIGAKASPWTPYAGFLWHRASLLRLVTPVLSAAVCKSSRIRHSPNSGTVRRFPVLPTAKSWAFCGSLPVFALERFWRYRSGGGGQPGSLILAILVNIPS